MMMWNAFCHRATLTSFLILAAVLTCLVDCFRYQRQQRQNKPPVPLPQLTLDITQDARILPTPHGDPVPKYDFKIDDVLNFTCTIKHPSFKYKMRIVKTSKFNEDEKGVDLIDESHELAASLRDQKRFKLSYDDEIFDEAGARYMRVSLIIHNLTLSDNGIYKCKYSNITKQVNTAVYKPLHLKDISFGSAHAPAPHAGGHKSESKHQYEVDVPISFLCRVAEAYPKPEIKFIHSSDIDLAPFTSEKELGHSTEPETQKHSDDPYYLHSVVASLNYTIKHTDHNQNLSCQVSNAPNGTMTKTIHLDVKGFKVIENLCKDNQDVKIGAADFNLTCVYFANPRRDAVWEHKTLAPKPTEAPAEDGSVPADSAASAAGTEESINAVSVAQPEDSITSYVEEMEPIGSGIYKAVITFKSVQNDDIKAYTFKLDDTSFSREIKLNVEDESK